MFPRFSTLFVFLVVLPHQLGSVVAGLFGSRLERNGGANNSNNKYSPLLLFRSNDSDSKLADEVLKDTVEKELGITVQRLYPLRNENHRKLLEKISGNDDIVLPFLYHRESLHSLMGVVDDASQVRAWARGMKPKMKRENDFLFFDDDDYKLATGLDLDEDMLLDDFDANELSLLEKKGKQSMIDRARKS